jgi:hypothetical protein
VTRAQSAKTAFDPVLGKILDFPPNSSLPLDAPLMSSDGTTLMCKRAAAQSLSMQMTSPVRFDLISARMATIARQLVDAPCGVEVVEFSPRASLGPLVLRAWKENQGEVKNVDDVKQLRVTNFFG